MHLVNLRPTAAVYLELAQVLQTSQKIPECCAEGTQNTKGIEISSQASFNNIVVCNVTEHRLSIILLAVEMYNKSVQIKCAHMRKDTTGLRSNVFLNYINSSSKR